MPTPADVFTTLYQGLTQPRQYFYELRFLKTGDLPITQFLKYPDLIGFEASKKAILARSRNEQGFNLYFGINPRKRQQGVKDAIAAVVALYVDIDVKDFLAEQAAYTEDIETILAKKPEVLQFIREQAKDLLPTILIDSGRGYQLYWVLRQPVILFQDEAWLEKVKQIEELNAALEDRFHADHCGNIDRIFRFPAFQNRKPVRKNSAELCQLDVQILYCDPARRYALETFQALTSVKQNEAAGSVTHVNHADEPVAETMARFDTQSRQLQGEADILNKAMNAKNGDKFRALWSGDWSGYKSQSEAEFALVSLLAFWTNNDRNEIDRFFRESGLYREKWNTPFNGTTNGWYTIDKVIARPPLAAGAAGSDTDVRATPEADTDVRAPTEVKFYQFWFEVETPDPTKVKIDVDPADLLHFLQINGFGIHITGEMNSQVADVVRVKNNIVYATLEQNNTNLTIRRFVLDFLEGLGEEEVTKVILRRACTFFSLNFLMSLKPVTLHFYRDTRNRCCFFFQNGFVRIRLVDGVTTAVFLPYSELHECIWASQITPRRYQGIRTDTPLNAAYAHKHQSEFTRFVELVSQETDPQGAVVRDNAAAFRYGLSYLLHSYKDVARAFALLFVDNDPSDFAHGRRGKSLLARAVDVFRNMIYEDGKTLNTESQFVFQSITADAQVVQMEDVRKTFDFELFYPTITGPCVIEQKGQCRRKIPFDEAPKFVFTSNRPILGSGDSDLARWFILPFVGYFNRHYTPYDEFGHRLFEDWDAVEWQNFFDSIIDGLMEYLSYSNCPMYDRPEADLTTYNEEKLKGSMDAEYLEYFEQRLAHLPFEIAKNQFFEDFKDRYPVFADRKITQNRFTHHLKIYCQARNLAINAASPDGRLFETDANGVRWEYLVITTK